MTRSATRPELRPLAVAVALLTLAACGEDRYDLGATSVPTTTPPQVTASSSTTTTEPRALYVLRAGDTLSGIAARFEITVEALMAANGLDDPEGLQVGDDLVIPPPTTLPDPGEDGPDTDGGVQ